MLLFEVFDLRMVVALSAFEIGPEE